MMIERKWMRSRHEMRVVCAALIVCSAIAGCKKKDEAVEAPVATVAATKPTVGPISEEIQGDAILAPLAQAALSPKISAPVRQFYVKRGAHVKAGQVLVALENRDLQATALDNQGTYTAAQGTYAQTTRAQVPEDVQKAELDVAQTKATLDLDQSIVNARQQLFQQGAIPGRDLDTAKATLVQAKVAYDTATKHLQSVQRVSRAAALETARGQLTSAKGKFLTAEAQVSYSQLRSPISGVVTDRPLFAGETAAAGTPLITVMDTSSLLAKVHFSQAVAQRMKIGDDGTVTVPGVTDPVKAKVSLISPALDPGSTTVEVWLRLPNPDGTFKVGTPVHVSVVGTTVKDAVTVPVSALITAKDNDGLSVMIVGPDGAAHRKAVTVGIRTAELAQITSGITPSDTVITTGGYGLDEGTKVKVGAADDKGGDDKPAAGEKPAAGKPAGGKDND
jgi:HlyD family secretion protein